MTSYNNTTYSIQISMGLDNRHTKFTIDTQKALNLKEHTLAVFIDLSKAFDTIKHEMVLSKLNYCGITEKALQWFFSYFLNRT